MLGVSLASFEFSVFVVEGILIRQILPWLSERRTIVLGFMFKIRIFLVFGFLASGFWALFLAPILALGSVAIPTMRNILANKGEANKQGEIQGIVPSIQSLTVIFATLVLTYVFYASTRPDGQYSCPAPRSCWPLPSLGSLSLILRLYLRAALEQPKL